MTSKSFKFINNYENNKIYPSNGIHSYTARFIPQIPRYFIKKYTQKNDLVLDPFCGSGTTFLESRLLSRNSVGIDINQLAVLISKVKTTPLNMDELRSTIDTLKYNLSNNNKIANSNIPNVDYWFSKKSQNELSKIKYCINQLKNTCDKDVYDFILVNFSSIIRKSSYADTRTAKTYKSKRVIKKINNGWTPEPIKYFEESLEKNTLIIENISKYIDNNNFVKVFHGDAKDASEILKNNKLDIVDFIITSPPYINAQDYFRSYKLELWWLGLSTPQEVIDLKRKAIGSENVFGDRFNPMFYDNIPKSNVKLLNMTLNKLWNIDKKRTYIVYNYFENMNRVFNQLSDILKSSGYFCLTTGNNTICGIQIPTYKILIKIAELNGFKLVEKGRDEIKNRSLPPSRNHNCGFIKEEWITVFCKD